MGVAYSYTFPDHSEIYYIYSALPDFLYTFSQGFGVWRKTTYNCSIDITHYQPYTFLFFIFMKKQKRK